MSAKTIRPPVNLNKGPKSKVKSNSMRPRSATFVMKTSGKNGQGNNISVPTALPNPRKQQINKSLLEQSGNLRRNSCLTLMKNGSEDEETSSSSNGSEDTTNSTTSSNNSNNSNTINDDDSTMMSHQDHLENEEESSAFDLDSTCTSPRSNIPEPERQLVEDIRIATENDDDETGLDISMAINIIQHKNYDGSLEGEKPEVVEAISKVAVDVNEKERESTMTPDTLQTAGYEVSPSCTLSVSSAFTPDSIADNDCVKFSENNVGSYGDILKALEKMDTEGHGTIMTNNMEAAGGKDRAVSTVSAVGSVKKSGDKMSELFNFLDSVEKETDQQSEERLESGIGSSSPMKHCETPDEGGQKKSFGNIMTLAKESPHRLAEKLVKSGYVIEEHERSINVLKKALDQQKKVFATMTNKFHKELDERLRQQRAEYEGTVKRHQTFIDQLIEDKKTLSERCDHLHLELKNQERKHQDSIRNMEQRHSAELRRVKSLNETSSKLKQERWMDEKTRRIREQTARGLEPEIARLVQRHSAEVSDLESERERALRGQERDLHQRHVQHVRELKALWDEELCEAVQRERQAMTQRHQLQLDELSREHESEVIRLQEAIRRERQRAVEERDILLKDAEQIRKSTQDRLEAEGERIREEEEAKRRVLVKKHAAELSSLKESEWSDRAEWEREFREKVEAEWEARRTAAMERARREAEEEFKSRDERRDREVKEEREAIRKEADERIERLKTKLSSDCQELESESATLRSRLTSAREKLALVEEEAMVAKATIKQKDVEAEQIRKTNQKLESEREDVRNAVRGEFATALEGMAKERGSLMKEVSELRRSLAEMTSAKEAVEAERKRQVEQEVEKIHQRVKTAIVRKDELIRELRENHQKVLDQNKHLEILLERHTKEKLLLRA